MLTPEGWGFWYKNAIIGYKRKHLEICKVGMRSEAFFAAGQGRQKVRGAPGTSPSNLPGPGSSSHQLVVSFSSSHLPLLAALQGSSPWPRQALSRSGLRRPGGSFPTWQLVFCAAEYKQDKTAVVVQERGCCVLGPFWGCLLQRSFAFPMAALSSEASLKLGVCV